jgi:uncharacterized Zn finger protein
MSCPFCGSESVEILKSNGKKTKELLFRCFECKNIYREIINKKKLVDTRIIISKFDSSEKRYIKLQFDEIIELEDVLNFDEGSVKITSIETKKGARVKKSPVSEIETIWALSLDLPARVGISIDFNGKIFSKKVDVEKDFVFEIGDIIKLGKKVFKVHTIKTMDKRLKKGFAKASVIKRVYGRPLEKFEDYNYDLTIKVVG